MRGKLGTLSALGNVHGSVGEQLQARAVDASLSDAVGTLPRTWPRLSSDVFAPLRGGLDQAPANGSR